MDEISPGIDYPSVDIFFTISFVYDLWLFSFLMGIAGMAGYKYFAGRDQTASAILLTVNGWEAINLSLDQLARVTFTWPACIAV